MSEMGKTNAELLAEIEELKKQLADKKNLEKELAKARILMQAAFDQSPVPLVVVTYPDFAFKIINHSMEEFLCVNAVDYLNKTPFQIKVNWKDVNPDGSITDPLEAPLPNALKGIITKNKESFIIRHDGSKVCCLASSAPIYDDEGQLIGAIYAATDITERKKSEQLISDNEKKLKEQNEEYEAINEELRETNELLHLAKAKAEESDRLKTAFLQNMSHEIRTPMNAIMGFSDLLLENADDKEKLKKYTKIINQRCNDLLEIISDILDISKIESGQLSVSMEECDLNELIFELTNFFSEYQERLNKKHILLDLHALCTPSGSLIITDKVKLKQIFINLINNAFKFTDEGQISGGCRLDGKNNLEFYITDTGIGIPKEKYNEIFERFIQLSSGSKKNYGGTGLGLSIVKALVQLMGGEIKVDSELGKGSTFYFTIPFKPINITSNKTDNYIQSNKEVISQKTVLIVEDDFYNAEYLKEIFNKLGFEVLHTEFGEEAVKIASLKPLYMVLMDIRLPDMNGYEATRQILSEKPTAKIIAQTAYAAQDERQKALDAGCVDYISKPTKCEMLLTLVRKHIK